MIICFEVVFNRVLSNSKTHLIVKLEAFPHLRRARAGLGWSHGAVLPPSNRNCKFHLLQNNTKKRSMLNINIPETIPAVQKYKFIVQPLETCKKFAMESIRRLSSIALEHDFYICA
jgi:hypothetical protein